MLVVFIANLGRPALAEAEALAPILAMTPYETRLALAVAQPTIVLTTTDRNRANDVLGVLRSRGHVAHVFDDESFVASEAMTKADDFTLDADGMRAPRTASCCRTATSTRSCAPSTTRPARSNDTRSLRSARTSSFAPLHSRCSRRPCIASPSCTSSGGAARSPGS